MPHIDLRLQGDGAFQDLPGEIVHQADSFLMTGLRDGMVSGKPSIMFAVPDGKGNYIAVETSYDLLVSAIRALTSRWDFEHQHYSGLGVIL